MELSPKARRTAQAATMTREHWLPIHTIKRRPAYNNNQRKLAAEKVELHTALFSSCGRSIWLHVLLAAAFRLLQSCSDAGRVQGQGAGKRNTTTGRDEERPGKERRTSESWRWLGGSHRRTHSFLLPAMALAECHFPHTACTGQASPGVQEPPMCQECVQGQGFLQPCPCGRQTLPSLLRAGKGDLTPTRSWLLSLALFWRLPAVPLPRSLPRSLLPFRLPLTPAFPSISSTTPIPFRTRPELLSTLALTRRHYPQISTLPRLFCPVGADSAVRSCAWPLVQAFFPQSDWTNLVSCSHAGRFPYIDTIECYSVSSLYACEHGPKLIRIYSDATVPKDSKPPFPPFALKSCLLPSAHLQDDSGEGLTHHHGSAPAAFAHDGHAAASQRTAPSAPSACHEWTSCSREPAADTCPAPQCYDRGCLGPAR